MMALIPVSCCSIATAAVTISMGEYLRVSITRQLWRMLTPAAASAAAQMSAYSICGRVRCGGFGEADAGEMGRVALQRRVLPGALQSAHAHAVPSQPPPRARPNRPPHPHAHTPTHACTLTHTHTPSPPPPPAPHLDVVGAAQARQHGLGLGVAATLHQRVGRLGHHHAAHKQQHGGHTGQPQAQAPSPVEVLCAEIDELRQGGGAR